MREALLYKKFDGKVKCNLCYWHCTILPGKRGMCGVRENREGTLYSVVYGKPCSVALDPIEKKPLFHFLPGRTTLSLGTIGCNLFCRGCQNFDISRNTVAEGDEIPPGKIISEAKRAGSNVISFTYNEPTMFYEYLLDIAKLARKENIRTVMVSNGYMSREALSELVGHIDAFNIDLKGFTKKFYMDYCKTRLEPVLENLKFIAGKSWLEVTNLLIPGLNDDPEDIDRMCAWLKDNLGDIPLHFSRFFPMYMATAPSTSRESLEQARTIAKKYLSHVYIGNIQTRFADTICPKCNTILIRRERYSIVRNTIREGKCPNCGEQIAGIWEKS